MSDDENTVAREIEKQTKGYRDGQADTWENRLPNAAVNPSDYGIRMGRVARDDSAASGSGVSGNAERQTFGEVVSILLGLAGLAASCLVCT